MKYLILLAVIIISFAACEKDVEVKIPVENSKLVLNGLINANNTFRVTVGKSLGILDTAGSNSFTVNNAFIQLYENGLLKDTLLYNATNNLYAAKNNSRALPGNTYLLNANAPGLVPVQAETAVPATIVLQNIIKRENAKTDNSGNQLDEIKFSFLDNSQQGNFYLIKIKRPIYQSGNTVQYEGIYCIKSTDKDIDRGAGSDPTDFESCIDQEFLISDKNFNGKLKELVVFINHSQMASLTNTSNGRTYKPVIELNHITQDHYKYRKSFTAYKDAEDNPFAEPVLVYGNIKNGYGIFSAFNLSRDTIR